MATLDINIDPNTIQSVRDVVFALERTFQASFVPDFLRTLDDTLPLQSATFVVNTEKQQYEFGVEFGIKIGEEGQGEDTESKHLVLGLAMVLKPDKATGKFPHAAEFGAKVEVPVEWGEINGFIFEGRFTEKMGSTLVLQCNLVEEQALPLASLVGGVAPALGLAIPEELSIPIRQNFLLVLMGQVTSKRPRLLMGGGLSAGVDLGQLPLVGLYFTSGQTTANVSVDLLVATARFTKDEVKGINGVLEEMSSPMRIRSSSATVQELEFGASLVAYVAIGEMVRSWYMPLKRRRTGTGVRSARGLVPRQLTRASLDDIPLTLADNGAWLTVQRAVGPVHFEKLGLVYRDGAVQFVPEIVLSVGDLKLSLTGMAVRLPLPSGATQLLLEGFGLEYENATLRIAGAFLRKKRDGYEEYAGIAALQMGVKGQTLGLAAIGAYAVPNNGEPSLFLYATLDYPLGGPPFFFVTGLAAGFGYNRAFTAPALEDVQDFPLVKQAVEGTGKWDSDGATEAVATQLEALTRYLKIQPDTGFLTLGVKFTSFKMLDGFALLYAAIGKGFELGLLGLARLTVPFSKPGSAAKDPLVFVELALQARFAPEEGVVMVRGQLTPSSYLLGKACKLTGGFAFATWFAGPHAGDFVLTQGGYHPSFKKPSHYPDVPRVGFHWQVDSKLSISGESYFALCAHAVMAGGYLKASYESGSAWASFTVGADFLISWRPYAYDIRLYVSFKAGLGCLKGSIGADLHLWGPSFGGKAQLDFWLFSVSVKFGNQGGVAPVPIGWDEFRSSFLPEDREMVSAAVAEGLLRQYRSKDEEVWIVNPKEFVLVTDSVIPSKKAVFVSSGDTFQGNQSLGVAPMAVETNQLESEHRVSIKYGNTEVAKGKFIVREEKRKVPEALWGAPKTQTVKGEKRLRFPGVNDRSFVEDTLAGLRIEPAPVPNPADTKDLPVELLRYETTPMPDAYAWQTLPAFRAQELEDDARRNAIRQSIARNPARDALLESLGFVPAEHVTLRDAVADLFVFAPQVKEA
ncbi:DUF6603 domain-containing protein [Stigmatella aurantiaca]|uniref:Transcriptional activator n=1 Tax=Stigmatella aurantiaca (strain DW4/3-1) TaxID=378806 RepID=Q094A9_STIAD|nr:DUF6603 domain-containing protein [Stigmatella aurantiaca]ADO70643.1 transcriptional activator [Stigmatella aurantiaca DW4/3-1]EAU67051.1 putative transcriptional activator srcap homolog [Stigmatella aurantiaca DW4/3-1]